MRAYNFQHEIQTMVTMFISALDDVIVKRFTKDKDVRDIIKVRFVYAPKQRVLLDIIDKAQNIQLPVVAVTLGALSRDTTRVYNKIQGFYIPNPQDTTVAKRMLQPLPVDLTLNVSILTRYQSDYDQIISQLVYFDPYINISWRIPTMPDQEIRSQVIWSGTLNTTYPTDLNASQVARVQGETSFTFKGWLFKSILNENKIINITTDYSHLNELTSKYSLDQLDTTMVDRLVLSGAPQPQIIEVN